MSPTTEEFTHVFRIENFGMAPHGTGEFIGSPTFIAFDDAEWSVRVYPRGDRRDARDHVSCGLHREEEDRGPEEVRLAFDFELLDAKCSPQESQSVADRVMKRKATCGFPKFVKRDALLNCKSLLMPNDTLSVRCVMRRKAWSSVLVKQDQYLRTRVCCDDMESTWRVRDFSKLDPRHIQRFVVRHRKPEFSLSAYVDDGGNLALDVELPDATSELASPIVASARIAIVDGDCRETDLQRGPEFYVFEKSNAVWEFPRFVTKKVLHERGYVEDDAFTLACSIKKSTGVNISRLEKVVQGTGINPMAEEEVLNKDMRQLLEGDGYHDVKLKLGDDSRLAHRFLLHARSPFFRRELEKQDLNCEMLELDVTEDVKDLATLKRLLEYMYCEHIDQDLDPMDLLNLLKAAATCQVLDLKERCGGLLLRSLNLTTARDAFTAGRELSLPELVESAVDFYADNWDEVSLSQDWEDFLVGDKEGAAEAMRLIRAKRNCE